MPKLVPLNGFCFIELDACCGTADCTGDSCSTSKKTEPPKPPITMAPGVLDDVEDEPPEGLVSGLLKNNTYLIATGSPGRVALVRAGVRVGFSAFNIVDEVKGITQDEDAEVVVVASKDIIYHHEESN